jgi:NodT family efflux transporter outer membrane factor (OMF) lipoprotein
MVGPSYVRPDLRLSPAWTVAEDARVSTGPAQYRQWWAVFNDPVLDRLIDTAYRQNLTLAAAGVRVLEARAQLGIAKQGLLPQSRQIFGALDYNSLSRHSAAAGAGATLDYAQDEVGLSASWELDFWGRFRRAIESADASLRATVADYDAVLVSLTADVASSYIVTRTLEKRLEIAARNVDSQRQIVAIAEARFAGGATTRRDLEQAKFILNNTLASIPFLQGQLRQAQNGLSILLGLPPGSVSSLLDPPSGIPAPPARIAIGVPSDLIRRRPDIRSAEYQAMAQGARIGLAKADLYPAFSLSGTFSFLSTNLPGSKLSDIFTWGSTGYSAGPSILWNILNYTSIVNNVRVQDARFQELVLAYQNAVLAAQREVEDGLAGYLRGQEQARFLAESAQAAKTSLDLAVLQYKGGTVDFTTVLTSQAALLTEQDSLASTLGAVSGSLVNVYRALGGGWETRGTPDLVPEEIRRVMAERTNWGDLLAPPERPGRESGD